MEPCTITVEPHAGARIQETFADARAIATLVNWPVLVRGNGVEVDVQPDMDDDACRVAYETAMEQRDRKEKPMPQATTHQEKMAKKVVDAVQILALDSYLETTKQLGVKEIMPYQRDTAGNEERAFNAIMAAIREHAVPCRD